MDIQKIVITGGPCAGKSTALSWIQKAFTHMGYTVLFVSETATELISGGVAPWTCGCNRDYQLCQISMQIEKERIYTRAAHTMPADKILIVHDRGALDNKAYMTEAEFDGILEELHTNEVELRDGYGAVFHLVTAAKGAEEFYTLSNNAARTETAEQAAEMDDKIIAAWTGHPHLRVIDNSTDFEQKMHRLIAEISSFLGEPEPMEMERRFLIRYPDLELLERLPNCRRIEIIQTYLTCPDGHEEVRVRQRGEDGHYVYFKTIKRAVSGVKRVEIEERLTQEEYLTLLMEADMNYRPIRKNRYCLTYQNQYFEIDVYPFWKDQAIAEIEVQSEDAVITFPDFIEVIREVTEEERFQNKFLARID